VVREIWFIVTLVTHSSGWAAQGRAEVSTSASIRWIRLSYTYSDESSRVVVYWMKSHDMLGCCMSMGWWKYNWLYDEYVIGSSLPFCCLLYVLWCGFSFAMIINLIDGSRWTRFSWPARKWRFRCLVHVDWTIASFGLFFKAMAPGISLYWIVNF